MSKFNYNFKVFGFKEDEVWDHIMFIAKENLEIETATAISPNIHGEARAHACGRAQMLTDFINTLQNERIKALEALKSEVIG